MKKSAFAIFAGLCLMASGAMAEVVGDISTPISNAGFDEGTGSFTNTGDGAPTLDFAPGWRTLTFGGAQATYAVIADANAPSAPNVMQITEITPGATFDNVAMDRDYPDGRINGDFQPGRLYTYSAWFKRLNPASIDVLFRGALFDHDSGANTDLTTGYANEGNWLIGMYDVWTNYTYYWTAPFAANQFSFQVIPGLLANPGVLLDSYSFQCDSFAITDVTQGERFINGRFNDSDSIIVNWKTTLADTVNRGMIGTITTDPALAYEGNNALNIVKTNPTAAGDALFRSNDMPWFVGHTAYLAFSVKNDPTYGADSNIEFTLHTNDGTAEGNAWKIRVGGAADGGYKRYEYEIPITADPINVIYLDMRLRDNTNNTQTQEAAYVDFISLGDLTVNGVPVEMSSFDVE